MIYDQEYGTLNLTAAELSALKKQLNCPSNDLAARVLLNIPDEIDTNTLQEFEALEVENKASFEKGLKMLAAPDQAGMLSYSIGERSISRLKLAWVHGEEDIAVLGRTGLEFSLALQSREKVLANIEQVLAIYQPLSDSVFNVSLSAAASLLILVLADCYRADWYKSALANSLPLGSYTLKEIDDRLKNDTDDFRWSLPFFAQTLPVNLSEALPLAEVEAGLTELAELELLNIDGDRKAGEILLYKIGDELELISDGLLNNVGKIALTISSINETGSLATEAIFFARDASHLWLTQISGSKGAVANINQETFENIIDIITLLPGTPTQTEAKQDSLKSSVTDSDKSAPPEITPPHSPEKAKWFIVINGEIDGPHSREEIKIMLAKGNLKPDSFVWCEGMPDWLELSKIDDLI